MQDTECDIPNDQAQATAFFMRLDDKRYGHLKADIRNKVIDHPADLNSAFKQAAERVEVTTRDHSIVSGEQLMHIRDEPNRRNNRKPGRGGGRGSGRGTGRGGNGRSGRGQENDRGQESDRASEDDESRGGSRDGEERQDRGGRGYKNRGGRSNKGPERKDKQCVCRSRNHSADDCPHTDRIRQLLHEEREAERAMTQFRRNTEIERLNKLAGYYPPPLHRPDCSSSHAQALPDLLVPALHLLLPWCLL